MKIFAIGDLHLSFDETIEKPMDIFGGEWVGHTEKLHKNWLDTISAEDLVIICGDVSWGLRMGEAMADLDWIHRLPGHKVIFKGNHDLWWQSAGRLNKIYDDDNMVFVQSSCYIIADHINEDLEKTAICGTRGWICPGTEGFNDHDRKIYERECLRLKLSLDEAVSRGAEKIIGVLHFPPTNDKMQKSGFTDLMSEYGVKTCVYGHLHGKDAFKNGMQGVFNGVEYKLVSLDYVEAMPKRIV